MTHTTTENQLPAAEDAEADPVFSVVEALLGPPPVEGGEAPPTLDDDVARIAAELDVPRAETYAEMLVAHLSEQPEAARELEALLVLGLAFPSVLEEHAVPLAAEGRRLALLLERDGRIARAEALLETIAARSPSDRQLDHELASMMRRTGNADRLIDRYMRRAEECVAADRTKEAISWLQEILLVDRSRRDVARMIRDLRWGDQEKRRRWKRGVRTVLVLLLVAVLAILAVQRELRVAERFAGIPPAAEGQVESLRGRIANLERFEQEHPFSIQLWEASRERAHLKADLAVLEARSAQAQIARRTEREAQLAIAESARKQGRIFAQQNRFADALGEFERALALGPADWDQRARIQVDVTAIREWIVQHGARAPGSTR